MLIGNPPPGQWSHDHDRRHRAARTDHRCRPRGDERHRQQRRHSATKRQLRDLRSAWTIPADDQPRLVQAIVNRVPGPGAVSDFASGTQNLGAAPYGGGGAQGISPAADALLPVTLPGILPANATALTASTLSGSGQLDAIQLTPLIAVLITTGGGHSVALLNSEAISLATRTISLSGTGPAVAASYDSQGRLWRVTTSTGPAITVPVPPGGFAIVQR